MRPTLVCGTVIELQERDYRDVTYIVYRAGDKWYAETEAGGVGVGETCDDVIALAEFAIDDEDDDL